MCLRCGSGMSFQHTERKRGRDKQKQKKHYHCFAKENTSCSKKRPEKFATKTMQTPPVASLCPSPSKPSNSPWTFIGPTCNHTPESHKLHAIKLQHPKFPMSKNIKWPEANHTHWNSKLYDQAATTRHAKETWITKKNPSQLVQHLSWKKHMEICHFY